MTASFLLARRLAIALGAVALGVAFCIASVRLRTAFALAFPGVQGPRLQQAMQGIAHTDCLVNGLIQAIPRGQQRVKLPAQLSIRSLCLTEAWGA